MIFFFFFCNLGFSFGISIWLFSFLSSSSLFCLPFFPFFFLSFFLLNSAKPQFKMQNPTCGVLISNKLSNHLSLPSPSSWIFFLPPLEKRLKVFLTLASDSDSYSRILLLLYDNATNILLRIIWRRDLFYTKNHRNINKNTSKVLH